MTLFDFILSLLLVLNPSMPESTFDQVYSVLDDTQIHSVLVNDSAVEALAELAGNSEIMPLEFGQSDSATLNSIYRMLYTGSSDSVADWTRSIYSKLDDFQRLFSSFSDDFKTHAQITTQIYDFLKSGNEQSGLVGLLSDSNRNTDFTWRYLEQINGQLTDFVASNSGGWDKSFPVDWFYSNSFSYINRNITPIDALSYFRGDLLQSILGYSGLSVLSANGTVQSLSSPMTFAALFSEGMIGLSSNLKVPVGDSLLLSDGSFYTADVSQPIGVFLPHGLSGLANRLSGDDRFTLFSFLNDDLSSTDEVVANNLLDALGLVGTHLQNPLQRLAYVFANPQDIQIREDVSANVDQAQQDFFKGDGGGSVKPADIKDAAGISGGAAGALESPGSVGDLTAQINNQDNFSFFSDVTLGNLDSVPSTLSEDDDFLDFYDPSNPALWEALNDEPVS